MILKYGTTQEDLEATVYTFENGAAKELGPFSCPYSYFYYDPRGNGVIMQQCTSQETYQSSLWQNESSERGAVLVYQDVTPKETIHTIKIENDEIVLTYWDDTRMIESKSDYMKLPNNLWVHSDSPSGHVYTESNMTE